MSVRKALWLPRFAPVVGTVDPAAGSDVVADLGLTGPDVDDARVRGCDGEGSHARGRLVLEERLPGAARIVALPHPADRRPEVKDVRPAGHALHTRSPSPPKRADPSPPPAGEASPPPPFSPKPPPSRRPPPHLPTC